MKGEGAAVCPVDCSMAAAAAPSHRRFAGNLRDRLTSPVIIFALTLAYNSIFYQHVHGEAVGWREFSQHCGIYADGVRGLDCFSRNMQARYSCTWHPGERTQGMTYTLVVQQRRADRIHSNITGSSLSNLRFFTNSNVTVEVYQDMDSANCSKAVFTDWPGNRKRCDPPSAATFRRQSGKLEVKVTWPRVIRAHVQQFHLRHRVLGSQRWNESLAQSENAYVQEDLNATLAYGVQIQCVTSKHCSQCDWSEVYIIPPELTVAPVLVDVNETNFGRTSGRRLLTLAWESPFKQQQHDSYLVTVGKASGEGPRTPIQTARPQVALILSYSAYHLQVSAVNNVSSSPALHHIVQEKHSLSVGKLNVTIKNNTAFTIHWGDNLIQKYVCYSAEWRTKGGKTVHMPFYQGQNNYRTLSPLPEALEPQTRYSLTLHTRPDKASCNMKSVNNSESTYGTTQFYLSQGTPVAGPENITFTNVTLDSAVLQWSVIPEEDLRGFLLGYKICYAEYNYKEMKTTENQITVGPQVNAYTLGGLKGGTEYEVQISGLTGAGEGAPSRASLFTATEHPGSTGVPGLVIMAIVFVTITVIFGTLVVERAKALLWPSIPNPRHSHALQKLGRPCQLELLSINTLKVEERHTDSLQIVDKGKQEQVAAASAAEALLPRLLQQKEDREEEEDEDKEEEEDEEDEDHSAEVPNVSIQSRLTGWAAAVQPYIPADVFTGGPQVDLHTVTLPVVASGYTTLEMLQLATPQGAPASMQTSKETRQEKEEEEVRRSCSYIRQFSIHETEMSTFL